MSDIAIQVRGLGKRFRLGKRGPYRTFRESITDTLAAPFRKREASDESTFWALKDVNFDVKRGEVVGIIGRNGAGKSTLLKVLSRITRPTEGSIELHGRVGSLLEVGTGFHPELTGRENIYLNGAILGMRRGEIAKKFDEIVAFAETEKFLDTPVKHYSSGMYTRLAFAVAAHLEPEILIVDEVLAVGDAEFQKKCMGKMQDVAGQGRTVLFVSHNMGAISSLCTSGVLLHRGCVEHAGPITDVIERYMGVADSRESTIVFPESKSAPQFRKISVRQEGKERATLAIDHPIEIRFEFDSRNDDEISVGLAISNQHGICVQHASDEFGSKPEGTKSRERTCVLPPYALNSGRYQLDAFLMKRNYQMYHEAPSCLAFTVEFEGRMADRTTAADWRGINGPGLPAWQFEPAAQMPLIS